MSDYRRYLVSVAEGMFFRFAELRRLTFCGPGKLCMSNWATDARWAEQV